MTNFWDAVLKQIEYFNSGNYLTLKKIVEDSYIFAFGDSKYNDGIVFEVSRFLEIVGIIEINDRLNQIRWVQIESIENLRISKTVHDLNHDKREDIVLFKFTDKKLDGLLNKRQICSDPNSFLNQIIEILPPPYKIVESCTSSRIWSEYIRNEEIEIFEFNTASWNIFPTRLLSETSLIRRRLDNGQIELLIVNPKNDICRKILAPEWAYLLFLREKKVSLGIINQNNNLVLKGPIKLPSILNKVLLLACSEVQFNFGHHFKLGNSGIFERLTTWLTE